MKLKFLTIILLLFITIPLIGGAQITPRPSYDDFIIDIVWKAETYTPPGFMGKSLPIKGSSITVVALTPTQNIQNLEFSWIIKDISAPFSGVAKKKIGDNTFSFTAERLIPGFTHEIEVVAKNIITGKIAKSGVNINLVQPEAYLYDSGTGSLFRKTIETFPGNVVEAVLYPFYFNSLSLDNLVFSWIFDGKKYSDDSQPDSINLSVSRETLVGTEKSLRAIIENKNSYRESAQISTKLFIKLR